MQDHRHSDAEFQSEDRIAAILDAIADEAEAAMPTPTPGPNSDAHGYPELPPGPDLTPETLINAIVQAARSIQTYTDTDPANVIRLTGLELRPDAKGRRIGAQGALGKARYEVAVWDLHSPNFPGHQFEVRVQPSEICELTFEALESPLRAQGFKISKNAYGDKPRISFSKVTDSGLYLHFTASTDSRDSPRCVSAIQLNLEPYHG